MVPLCARSGQHPSHLRAASFSAQIVVDKLVRATTFPTQHLHGAALEVSHATMVFFFYVVTFALFFFIIRGLASVILSAVYGEVTSCLP